MKTSEAQLKAVRKYRQNNAEAVREYNREWFKGNTDKRKEYNRRYRLKRKAKGLIK